MAEKKPLNRRRFLQATGVAATVGIAGCSQGGSEDTTETSGPTGTDISVESIEAYPYSPGENDVQSAQQVMEAAGYGPDNRFELSWLQYQSSTWEEIANTIRARLESAYIDMSISQADFGSLLSQTEKGSHEAFTLGWIADYPAPRNFLQLVDPANTIYDAEGATPNGARLFWDKNASEDNSVRAVLSEEFDRIQNNPEGTESAKQIRDEAVLNIEEAIWASAALLPVYHGVSDAFWYDRVSYDPPKGMGGSRAKANVSVEELAGKSRLQGISATFNSLDPVASGNTASGGKVMNMFDAPMNYPNGTIEVESLLIEDYTVSEDLTEYEFTLKQGMQFHGDYGEVTAADMVYSIRRLVESNNSTNSYFTNSVLNIEREVDKDGNVVPGSVGVEQTGDYSFTLKLQQPFSNALSVLAYSAFSVVPEGIVGDIEGYEGDMEWEEFSTNPIGSGPFEFVRWDPGNGGSFRVDRFDEYHGDVASIEGIDAQIITDETAAFNAFLNENADIAGIPTSKFEPEKVSLESADGAQERGTYGPLENEKTINMSRTPTIDTFYIGFNMRKVPKPVRQAMAYVMNRPSFVESVFKGRGEPAYHLTPKQVFPGGADSYVQHWQGNE